MVNTTTYNITHTLTTIPTTKIPTTIPTPTDIYIGFGEKLPTEMSLILFFVIFGTIFSLWFAYMIISAENN